MQYTRACHYLAHALPSASPPYGWPPDGKPALDSSTYAAPNPSTTETDADTLERILRSVTLPLYGLEPVEALQTAHRLSLKERIGELLRQLGLRHELTRSVKDRLKAASLDAGSQLLNLERLNRFTDPTVDSRRSQLESRLDGLYREGTREQHEFWKDQQSLREQLVELLNEYRLAAWRARLVTGLPDESGREMH